MTGRFAGAFQSAGGAVTVTVTYTPPAELCSPRTPVADVQAFIGADMIGGFRTLHYPPHIFADGFESGGVEQWSAAAP